MPRPFKARTKSKELVTLEYLNNREYLSSKEKQYYLRLKKGYEGEFLFDSLTEKLSCDCIILNDLLLEVNNTLFQIDTLIIHQERIDIFEVKYFDGDYYYESDKLFKKPNFEVVNPLHQVDRIEPLLRQLLLSLGFNPPINSTVVFNNPKFTFYQAPLDKPIILPNQVTKHLGKLNTMPSKLNENHRRLARKLSELHITDYPSQKIPTYSYDQLRKGMLCLECQSFSLTIGKRTCICEDCGYKEPVTSAVLRTVEEFKTLFPDKKVTTNVIHDWCKVVKAKRRIRNILLNNYTKTSTHRWTSYK